MPSKHPTYRPTVRPTLSPVTRSPSKLPTSAPSKSPSSLPTGIPQQKILPSKQPTTTPLTKSPTRQPQQNPTNGKYFDRIFVIMMENVNYATAIADPSFKAVAAKGRLLTNYHAASHPSQPNYISLIGGDVTYGSTTVSSDSVVNIPSSYLNLVDSLESNSLTWKSYNQWYTQGTNGACNTAASISGTSNTATCGRKSIYARKHNAFMSFMNIQSSTTRCSKIVGASQLATDTVGNTLANDIKAGTLANVNWYAPDLCNDCHDSPTTACGPWLLANFFNAGGYFSPSNTIPGRTLVMVVFDENEAGTFGPSGNGVYAVLIPVGNMKSITPGETCGAYYSHYSLLQLIEENWSLGSLGRQDAGSKTTIETWGGPVCVDTLANCNLRSYAGTSHPNNAKCSCSTIGNTCI